MSKEKEFKISDSIKIGLVIVGAMVSAFLIIFGMFTLSAIPFSIGIAFLVGVVMSVFMIKDTDED